MVAEAQSPNVEDHLSLGGSAHNQNLRHAACGPSPLPARIAHRAGGNRPSRVCVSTRSSATPPISPTHPATNSLQCQQTVQ
eukprot:278615-Chlamydomonas_euryale.AAC.1